MLREALQSTLNRAKEPLKQLVDRAPTVPTLAGYLHFRATHSRLFSRYKDADPAIMAELEREGFVVRHGYFSEAECRQAIADIDAIIRDKPQYVREEGDRRIFGIEELSPTVMRFHADPGLQAVSNQYSRRKTVNAFTLGSRVSPDIWVDQGWHRDARYRQFKAFLYLNEVTTENGPFQLIRRSQRMPQHLKDVRRGRIPYTKAHFSDETIERILSDEPSRLFTATGGPGTLILADTGTLHRGCPPRSGVRYALTNYYFERSYVTQAAADRYRPVNPGKMLAYRDNW